jgi:hypothetical protein
MSDDLVTTAAKHPRFMGMRGRSLDLMVSVIATTGFLLFGYDRKSSSTLQHNKILMCIRGRHVRHHICRAIHELLPRDST